MKAGSAADTLEVLDQAITDNICDGLDDASRCSHQGKHIKTTIKNTMPDMHSAEKFNSLLEDYRKKILSEVNIGWKDLWNEEMSGIVHLNSFFCGMHLMVRMTESANQAQVNWLLFTWILLFSLVMRKVFWLPYYSPHGKRFKICVYACMYV